MKNLLMKVVPATFAAGILVGVAATTAGAALKGSAIFMDVPFEHYANDAIGEMAGLGIIKGLDSTHFGPDDPITRGQVAILLQRLRNEMRGSIVASSSSSRSSSSSSSSSSTSSSSSSSSSSATTSSASSMTAEQCSPGGCVHFGAKEYNVDKNDATGLVTILIARIGGNTGAGTVDYAFNGGTATVDKDYKPVSGTLTFNNKETSKKVQIQIINNTAETANKNVVLTLSKPTGALKIDSPNPILLKINDTRISSSSSSSGISSSVSAATTVTLSASAYAVAENAGTITISVQRTGVTTGVTEVDFSTGNGSGQGGTDYTSTSGKLTFNAGDTTKTFQISVADNTTVDGAKNFSVNLSNPTNSAALDISTATVMINDNESMVTGSGTFKLSSSTYTVTESAGRAKITVMHAGGTAPSSVGYATTGGSALTGSDYTAVSGTLYFAQGETSKVFYIPIVNDGLSEGEETVNLTLQTPVGAPLGDTVVATVKIQD